MKECAYGKTQVLIGTVSLLSQALNYTVCSLLYYFFFFSPFDKMTKINKNQNL